MLLFRPARASSARAELMLIAVAGTLWGAGGVVVGVLHDRTGLAAGAIACYRLACAALVLLAVTRPRRLVAALRAAPVALVLAGVGLAAYQALYFLAVTSAGVAIATVVSIGVAPVLITIGESVVGRRIPGPRTAATMLASLTGLVLVTFAGETSASGPRPLFGIACATASGTVYAATTVLSRRTTASIPALPMTTVTTTVGALALTPLALATGVTFAPTPTAVVALALLGPVTTALAYALFYRGLRGTPASTASLVVLVEPVAAALLAVALLAEPLPPATILGATLLLTAVTSLTRTPTPTKIPVIMQSGRSRSRGDLGGGQAGVSPTRSPRWARWRSAVPRARASARARLR